MSNDLNLAEAAEALSVSTRTLHRYIKRGRIEVIQYVERGHIKIAAEEIERFRGGATKKFKQPKATLPKSSAREIIPRSEWGRC